MDGSYLLSKVTSDDDSPLLEAVNLNIENGAAISGEISSKANLGYVVGQLQRALLETSSTTSPSNGGTSLGVSGVARVDNGDIIEDDDEDDALQQKRRTDKIEGLEQAWSRILWGEIRPKASESSHEIPIWMTDSGCRFAATGNLMASLDPNKGTNESFLSYKGIQQMNEMLETGQYRVKYPEHCALLCVTWLIKNGHNEKAEEILESIIPYFSQIQFYPDENPIPLEVTATTSIATVGEVQTALTQKWNTWQNPQINRSRQLIANRSAILRWIPLKFRLLELFEQTVACSHMPCLVTMDGEMLNTAGEKIQPGQHYSFMTYSDCPEHSTGKCGWPCQIYPQDWDADASRLLHEYYEIVEEQDESVNRGRRHNGTTAKLIGCLKTCVRKGREALTGKQVGLIRVILASCYEKYGVTGSERWELISKRLGKTLPKTREYYPILMSKLASHESDAGLPKKTIEDILSMEDCNDDGNIVGELDEAVPKSVRRIVQRAQIGQVKELVGEGLVKSGEILASLVPYIVAESISSQITDIRLRRLCYALYITFERRQSVQLLDSESQLLALEELPWAEPILNRGYIDELTATRAALEQIVTIELESFPHTIFPNKLLRSMKELIVRGEMHIPLVYEITAEIFEGQINSNFVDAVETAGRVMLDTPYAYYYGLQDLYTHVDSESFVEPAYLLNECIRRANLDYTGESYSEYSVEENGRIVEWISIITTHNLASLVYGLDLKDKVEWSLLMIRTWEWIVQNGPKDHLDRIDFANIRSTLHQKKNTAYAWRQLLFYLSMVEGDPYVIMETLTNEMENLVDNESVRQDLTEQFLEPMKQALFRETIPANIILGWTRQDSAFV
eukprot:CAMPEP_0195304144 /NCGR_PEP_ID=MMETSP0707-20130614/33944_1 /TAXON_ID=33640 /ORGANISM="Asterionellopsis glacialis, Strain CCMP134" /LENGTH=850 /DNA_ID=CAMNT_0040367869 /DNA_START=60 /DNA_END=2612 /DNA_ORIENTATION=+